MFIEQGESTDSSNKPPPVVLEVKKKKKNKTTSKVIEVKPDEPMIRSVSPETKHATPGLLPYPHSCGKVTFSRICIM